MFNSMYFYLGIIIGGAVVWIFLSLLKKKRKIRLIQKQAEEKRRDKESILEILETQHPLTNNHVEMLLGISDSTATRYLDELEKEGKIRQVGKTGRYVYYERAD